MRIGDTTETRTLAGAMFLASFALLLYELLLTRLFAVVLFADFAHLALALALLGIAVGALAQHLRPSLMPYEGITRRLAWLAIGQGIFTLIAVVAAIRFPVLREQETIPLTYQDRSGIKDNLLDPVWFAALLPVLSAPFAFAGLAFAGTFQRRTQHIAVLYGADLLGAAAAAVVFLPILGWLAGPDALFVILLACALSATGLFALSGARGPAAGSGLAALLCVGLVVAGSRGDVLEIRHAAGYSEANILYTQWTPLTRLAIERGKRGDFMLLDNASASEIFQTAKRRDDVALSANRALVYRIHPPGAHIAILAASAGPEVASAQSLGHTDIDAIDIASEIFDIVAERYPDSPVNPYLLGNTHRIHSDGRAAILRAERPYDVIQMVHANLWSSAGLLSNAWSPALLETKEAFRDYFNHLTPDGTVSFGKGAQTDDLLRSAVGALVERGVKEPWRCVAYLEGDSALILVKTRPWTEEEHALLVAGAAASRNAKITMDPMATERSAKWKDKIRERPALTDDHPWSDSPSVVWETMQQAWKKASGEATEPLAALYRSFVIQCTFVLIGGGLFCALPLFWRGRGELRGLSGTAGALGYVACLGYGYLAVETVLIHELVLFVGHPTFAITVVVLSMLLSSGVGSLLTDRLPASAGRPLLFGIVGLGAILAFAAPPLLYAVALSWPLWARCAVTGVMLAPLGLLMGTAFPMGLRALPEEGRALVPWAWAINGWMSVVASLATVLVARMWGYTPAFCVALAAYALAAGLAGSMRKVRRREDVSVATAPSGSAIPGAHL